MSVAPLILIIEDESPIRRLLSASFSDADYRINEAADGNEGLQLAAEYPPDLVVLDLGLPGMDGIEVIKQLRQWLKVPIIVLSARDQESQKILALDSGADDYVTKPFGMGELLARIRASLRHASTTDSATSLIEFGNVRIDLAARVVTRHDKIVHLTPLEYKLLVTMAQHPGKVLTHRYLLREVWGPNDSAETHYVRVFVGNLRRKLEEDSARPQHLLTEPGVGYRFAMSPD